MNLEQPWIRWVGYAAVLFVLAASGCKCSAPRGGTDPVLTSKEAARTCVILKSCFPEEWEEGVWTRTLYGCTTESGPIPAPGVLDAEPILRTGFEPPLADFYECVGASESCDAAGRCFDLTGSGGECEPERLADGECSDDTLEGCTADGWEFRVDCADYGAVCGEAFAILSEFNGCVLSTCSGTGSCAGDVARTCNDGSQVEVDCPRVGRSCEVSDDGVPACIADGDACDEAGERTCFGNTSAICTERDGGYVWSEFDCRVTPTQRRCEEGECVDTGRQCDESFPEQCDGDHVTFCQDGFVRSVDCTKIGFSSCQNAACR